MSEILLFKQNHKKTEKKNFLLPKGALLFQPRKVGAISLQNSSFSSVFFSIFPVSRKIRKTGIVFVASAGGCLVEEKEWYDLLERSIVFRSVYTLNPFMSWLILQNESQFPGLGKAGSALCKIGRGKSNFYCFVWSEVWRDKTQSQNMMIADGFPVFLFIFGWITEGWESYSRSWRHYVIIFPVLSLDWLPNFPLHRPGEGSYSLAK